MAARDLTVDVALPDNLDAERFILGAIMSNESAYLQVAGALLPEDFSLEKHKLFLLIQILLLQLLLFLLL